MIETPGELVSPGRLRSRIGWSLVRTLAAFLVPTPVEGSSIQYRMGRWVLARGGWQQWVGGDGFDAIGGNLDLAVDDYLAHNVNYLRVILGVKLPPLV